MNTLSDVVVQSPSRVQLFVTAMDCSTSVPVPHHLPELAQVHVHCIGDAVQPSHPLRPYSPSAFNLSHHQGQGNKLPQQLTSWKKKKTYLSSHFFCGSEIQAELSYLFCFKISFSRGSNKVSTWDPQSSQDLAGTELTSMLTQTNIWQDLVPDQETLFIRVRIQEQPEKIPATQSQSFIV